MNQILAEGLTWEKLKREVGEHTRGKIFVVTGKQSYSNCGAEAFVDKALSEHQFIRFSDFDVNPKYEDVLRGVNMLRETDCQLVIAIGGGSVIDMAKLVNIVSANETSLILEYIKNPSLIYKKGKPLIAIPTTAGTGSEATHFAVVYHNKVKYSLAHQFILPDIVGLNFNFIAGQSQYLAACTGLDALSQAIESFWSVGSTEESRTYACESIQILIDNLEHSIISSTAENRKLVMTAAYLAGKAINISKTTAAHALSYGFTTFYNIPHGHAVFLTLPVFLIFNANVTKSDINDPRGVDFVKDRMNDLCELLKVKNLDEAKRSLCSIAENIGIELSYSILGISNHERIIAQSINLERMKNNPRRISPEQIIKLLRQ